MILLVGLGNPGEKYQSNRHNVGFMAIDQIARDYHFPPFKSKFSAQISEGQIGDTKVILCKPMTYMNLSGTAVGQVSRFYKIPPEHTYVFHDELDIDPEKVKVKIGGGNGGHNGLASLDQHLGKEYWRVRIGIGHPGHRDAVTPYVLGDFKKADRDWLEPLLWALSAELPTLFMEDHGAYLTKIALRGSK